MGVSPRCREDHPAPFDGGDLDVLLGELQLATAGASVEEHAERQVATSEFSGASVGVDAVVRLARPVSQDVVSLDHSEPGHVSGVLSFADVMIQRLLGEGEDGFVFNRGRLSEKVELVGVP